MQTSIQLRNVEVPDETLQYIDRKLQKIQRRLNIPMNAHVVVSQEGTRSQQHRLVVEATINCNGTVLRGEERAPTVQAAIDAVADTLDRRATRFKGRLYRSETPHRHGQASSIRDVEAAQSEGTEGSQESEEEPLPSERVVRTKRFTMKPMDVEEAATQMELLGHSFFFFLNSATGSFNVLYRRQDGDYGLIEPGVSPGAASRAPAR